jgi:pimeloyl-[acyl-carrier protein] methyl ester esterase
MLHKRVLGSGPDLLLIHGWGMNSEVWNTLAEDLSSSYRLTLVDLPGHGGSPCASRPGGLRQWAESVLAVAPPEAIWVGWSLGGSIALQAALSAPARVKALVMVTATPRFVRAADWPHAMDEDTLSGFRAALARDPTTTLDRFLALQAQGGEGARALLRELRVRLAATPPPAAAALDSGLEMLRQVDLRDKLAQLEMPSLWLFGQRDALTPWRCGEQVKRLNGAAQVEVLAGAAHAPFLSHRAQALDLLRGFLEQAA